MHRLVITLAGAVAGADALPPPGSAATFDGRIQRGGFQPATIVIAAGDTVR